jgi:glycine/D-amino acid oxidase-like deaminating enzyme
MDRIIRTTVGLRPSRKSGFVLKAERLDDKTVIHNYGHGGEGMTLSWGTGFLAADLAMAHAARRAAVIGCGIVGLTAARQLQRRGFDVTIYAKAVPPNTTSNMSGACFEPFPSDRGTPEYVQQSRRAWEIAYREHQMLVGSRYGVRWIHAYNLYNDAPVAPATPPQPSSLPSHLVGWVVLGPGEHPFGTKYALQRSQLCFEPSIYLDALMRDVLSFGGRILTRTFDTRRDLTALKERLIVNCTGLGAKALFGDEELNPVKGQLHVLVPQPEVTYRVPGMTPRSDGIALGGTDEPGVWTLDVNEAAQKRIIERAAAVFNAMRAPLPGVPITGPGTTVPCAR